MLIGCGDWVTARSRVVLGAVIHIFTIPDCLYCIRIDLIQKATAILVAKDSCGAPRLMLEELHLLDLHHDYIAGLGAFDLERSRQVMDLCQLNISDVVGTVIIADLPSRPINALDIDNLAILDLVAERDCSKFQLAKSDN